MTKISLFGLALAQFLSTPVSAFDGEMNLIEDCYSEWKSRGWVVGEDETPANELPQFAAGVRKVCEIRSRLYEDDPSISPYIQARLPELAPYLFSADEKAIEQLVRKLQTRRPGQSYSGSFMRD